MWDGPRVSGSRGAYRLCGSDFLHRISDLRALKVVRSPDLCPDGILELGEPKGRKWQITRPCVVESGIRNAQGEFVLEPECPAR